MSQLFTLKVNIGKIMILFAFANIFANLFFNYSKSYNSMTIASLDGVANIPATATIFVCRTRARILCSRRVCSRVRLRLFRNFTATSRPVKISWQRRTTEKRPRPTLKNNLLIFIFLIVRKRDLLELFSLKGVFAKVKGGIG